MKHICAMQTSYPKISVITPSYNQGQFIEHTIRSVIDQNYPNLEFIIQDGGSKDNSVEIIKRYEADIDFWESGPDGGQSAAINKGFKRATGEFIMWINSDDMLAPGCLNALAESGVLERNRLIAGRCTFMKGDGTPKSDHQTDITHLEDLYRLQDVWYQGGQIVQPETIFCRELFWRVGGLDSDNHYCMDYDLWIRMLKRGGELHTVPIAVGMFRQYEGQKVSDSRKVLVGLCSVAKEHVKNDSELSESQKSSYMEDLEQFELAWIKRSQWEQRLFPLIKLKHFYARARGKITSIISDSK